MTKVITAFHQNYQTIVERCLDITPNVIVMMQYRPSFHMDEGGYGVYQAIGCMPGEQDAVAKLNQLMQRVYTPVLQLAKVFGRVEIHSVTSVCTFSRPEGLQSLTSQEALISIRARCIDTRLSPAQRVVL